MPTIRATLVFLIALILPAAPVPGEEEGDAAREAAFEFLAKVEEKHKETTSLQAEFVQLREDTVFLEEVRSEGRFWWRSPDLFRASLRSEHDSEIWIRDGKMYEYIPDLRQVDVVEQPEGEDAPLHQWLLGFGAKVEEIEKHFNVRMLPEAEEAGWVAIEFLPREDGRSFEFEEIVIHFHEEDVEPRQIVLDDGLSIITIELRRVRVNPSIRDSVFRLDWPDNVDVVDRSRL